MWISVVSICSTTHTLLRNSTDSMINNTVGISTSASVSFSGQPTLFHR